MPEAPAPAANSDRDSLTSRVLPKMVLSDGSATSLTTPPGLPPSEATQEERARLRFEVGGNAIITGGAGTLGLSAGRSLLEHGLSGLMIMDIKPSQSASEIAALQKDFPAATVASIAVDITNAEAVTAAVDQAASLLGPITHLLCFAGVVDCVHAIDIAPAAWRRVMEINTTGSFLCAQAVARQVIARKVKGGSIVFISSISAHRVNYPQPQASYNVSKSALLTLKNCLAAEWASYGIRVNSISPGYMDTVLNEGGGVAEARGVWAARNPMGRMGTPNELTGAVVLLSSAAGTYMNGTDIVVDGGQIVF